MIKNISIYSIIIVLSLFFSDGSSALDIYNLADQSTLRCRGGLVAVGDSDRSVQAKCGDPLDVQPKQDIGEIWIYQVGLSKFMNYLAFLNGKLQRIVSAPCSVNDTDCYDLR